MNRREFFAGVGMVAAAARSAVGQTRRTRLVLLGTGGGPRPRSANSASAQVIVSNGAAYVIDCGDGVARQMAFAGVPLASLRHVFITHQHSDHTADYGNLIWLAWTAGLSSRVDTWGPPPLERMTKLFLEMNQSDIDIRIAKPRATEIGVLAGAARSGAALVAELPSDLYNAWSDSESEVLPMRGDMLYTLRTGKKPKPMSDEDNLRLVCHEEVAFEAGLACGLAIARMGLSDQVPS